MPVVEQDWTSELSVLEAHDERIEVVAFSPTDKLVVTISSWSGRSGLWDYVTGTERFRFDERDYRCAAFSPDGKLVALGSTRGHINIREFGTGSVIDLKGHDGVVSHVAFPPKSSKILASTSSDYTLRIWNVEKRQTIWICCLQTGDKHVVAEFTPDGRFLIVGQEAAVNMTMWNVDTGECVKTFDEVDTSFVRVVAICMNGESFVCIESTTMASLYNLSTGKRQFEAQYYPKEVGSILLLPPDENLVLIGFVGGDIELRDINTWSVVRQFHTCPTARCFTVSRDGELLVSGGSDGTLRLWDMRSSAIDNEVPETSEDPVDFVRFSPDDSLILYGRSRESWAHMWDVADGSVKALPVEHVKSMDFSPDGRYVVLQLDWGKFQLWNKSMTTQILDSRELRKIVFSTDGSCIALFLTDGDVQIVDGMTFQEMLTWDGSFVKDIQFSPDGQNVGLKAGAGDVFELWNLPSRKRLWQEQEYSDPFLDSAHYQFTPNGQVVAFRRRNSELDHDVWSWKMLEVATGKEQWVHVPGDGLDLVFHPDSHLFASESRDSFHFLSNAYINIYETSSLILKHRFKLHGPVDQGCDLLSMEISATGKLVAASARERINQTVQMWDTATGMEIGRYAIEEEIRPLSFLNDRYLLCDKGRLPIPSSLPDQEVVDLENKQEDAQSCLYVGSQWVYQGPERILWLPPAYRSRASVFKGETLALVHETGVIRIIKFDLPEMPLSTARQPLAHLPS